MPDKGCYSAAYHLDGPEDARRLYASWAPDYDVEMVEQHGYTGPAIAAKVFAGIVADRDAWILDVGCGTGLVGQHLKDHGFVNIDGLDLVQEMLDQAAVKNVYERLIQADLLEGAKLNPDRYDAAISVGTFTHSHVGPAGFDEIVRLVKPGGVALIVVNAEAFVEEGYQAKLDSLEELGRIVQVAFREEEIVSANHVRGRILTLEIL